MHKILIINAWGGNRGDEAQVNGLFRLIKKIDPDCEVYCLPFRMEDLDTDNEMKKGSRITKRAGKYYYSALSRILFVLSGGRYKSFKNLIKRVLEAIVIRLSFIDLRFLKKYDLIISAPQGPTVSDIAYKEKKIYTLYPLSYARRNKIPYCIVGVSMGPFDNNSYREGWVEEVLSGAQKIILREDISYKNTLSKYPGLDNISTAIDIVFSSKAEIDYNTDHHKNYKNYSKRFLDGWMGGCISITPARDPRNIFHLDEYLKKAIDFFDFAIDHTGKKLLLFSHLKKDLPILSKIRMGSAFSDKMDIFDPRYNSDYQQDIIKELDFFISSRYHPTIFAIKEGVPFFCIINQFKTLGMLEKLNLIEEQTWQDDSLSRWKKNFLIAWDNKDIIIDKINSAQKKSKILSDVYLKELRLLIG